MKNDFFEIPQNVKRIKMLAKDFGRYCNGLITEREIVEYLQQFGDLMLDITDSNMVYKGVLEVLEQIDFWDWDRISSEVDNLLDKILTKCQMEPVLCPLGNEKDSSFRLLQVVDIKKRKSCRMERLEDILNEESVYMNLVFIDDGACSGNQVISIFQEWMGISEKKRKLKKKHVQELSSVAKEKLKKINIYLGYLNFCSESEKYIISELNALGIRNVEIVYLYEFKKVFETGKFSNNIIKNVAKKSFERAGKAIMFATHEVKADSENELNWTFKTLSYASLGYNDAQQTIVYIYNTPTYTLTALWNNSSSKNFRWKPLFLRKKSYMYNDNDKR